MAHEIVLDKIPNARKDPVYLNSTIWISNIAKLRILHYIFPCTFLQASQFFSEIYIIIYWYTNMFDGVFLENVCMEHQKGIVMKNFTQPESTFLLLLYKTG